LDMQSGQSRRNKRGRMLTAIGWICRSDAKVRIQVRHIGMLLRPLNGGEA